MSSPLRAPSLTPDMDDSALRLALLQLAQGRSLSRSEAAAAFDVIMQGSATPAQAGALLLGLRVKGETADEVAGAAQALRSAMVKARLGPVDSLVDTCGTGGGQVGTLNISTAAAFVVAGAGVRVAKHGNRSYTSRSGSADVLEALGVDINLGPDEAAKAIEAGGLVFLFAPNYHPAMRHLGPVRKELGVPTIMNLLGPLVNPAGVQRQVLGVADASRAPLLADALSKLGSRHALVLHGAVGMDEISPAGCTYVWEVADGRITSWELNPGRYGLACDDLDQLAGGEPAENAAAIERLLGGAAAPAVRCAVVLNAAAALYVSGNGWAFDACVTRSQDALDSGAAASVLARLRSAARA